MKRYGLLALTYFMLLLAFCLFVVACFFTASDAQGAIVWILFAPAILTVLIAELAVLRKRLPKSPAASFINFASAGFLVFVLLFLIGAFVPPLNFITRKSIEAVSQTFESYTGKNPYVWTQERNDIKAMIQKELRTKPLKQISFADFETGLTWDQVCFFGPYTANEAAQPVLQLKDWDLAMYSKISTTDSITALIFLERAENRVAYAIDFPRVEADFSKLSMRCFPKAQSVFQRIPTEGEALSFASDTPANPTPEN